MSDCRIGVVGAGSWGTALAAMVAEKGLPVTLWAYEPELVESITHKHRNMLFLPEVDLPQSPYLYRRYSAGCCGQADCAVGNSG